jgi:capsular polysaccharide transport system permease protein
MSAATPDNARPPQSAEKLHVVEKPAPAAPRPVAAKPMPAPPEPDSGKPAGAAALPQTAPQTQPANPAAPPPNLPGPMRPPVRRAYAKPRHFLVLLSFVLFVIAPSIVSGVYLWAVAVDQYASSVGFSVRREDAGSPTDVLSGLTNISGSSSSDTDILFEYLQSQKLVTEIDDEIDLHAIWSKPENDPVFALEAGASIEELMDYWERMVTVSYGTGAGLIEVEVRAFTSEDATLIAEVLFDKSSDMINQLSAIARADGIRYTQEELVEAENRLRSARETLTRFRNANQIVDPELDLRSQAGLLANLQEQKAASLIELDLLRKTARESDPRIEQAQRRLEVIDERIAQERQKLGGSVPLQAGGDQGFADLIGEYERLVVDREFAQEAYISARAAHDSSLSEARRKSRYLAAYMEPTRAQTAAYPKRFTLQVVITLFLFLLWGIAVMVYYSIKDRR